MPTSIDLFSGLGGWSEGARQAGVRVLWTANHWPVAVRYHAANHPEAEHVCQDLRQANWSICPSHDILFASPCCQGHSRARGTDKPQHDDSRSTAWAVVDCAEYHRPYVVAVENVTEFVQWSLYPSWRDAMSRLGYVITENVIDCADAGVPQNRRRLFLLCVQGRSVFITPPSFDHVPASQVVDFTAGRWSHVMKPGRAANTLSRWKAGRDEYGGRFLFSYYGATRGGRSLSRPIGTITTRDRWAVVDGDCMRMLSVAEAKSAMSFPKSYLLPDSSRLAMHLLGNAVPPNAAKYVATFIKSLF